MPQTLLALGALFLVGWIALQQHGEAAHEQERALRGELEAGARSVGVEVFEHLATLPFDAFASDDSTAFTPEDAFGQLLAESPLAEAADVDDVHGMTEVPVTRTLTDPATGTVHTLTYTLAADVGYVAWRDGALVRTGGAPSFAKEVVLEVRHPHLLAPLRLCRVYTP